jgi:hypothetical protein
MEIVGLNVMPGASGLALSACGLGVSDWPKTQGNVRKGAFRRCVQWLCPARTLCDTGADGNPNSRHPFFQVVNFTHTHEHNIWCRAGRLSSKNTLPNSPQARFCRFQVF